jgi:16S rRNA (guanine(527)-N(7))-methyltransferase RsmG
MVSEYIHIPEDCLWSSFGQSQALIDEQLVQFKLYFQLLNEWNARMNLTTITELADVVAYHFQDSLALGLAYGMDTNFSMVDIGSGAGFPGIALKIKYPHMRVILVEVVQKKINFLRTVIKSLGLNDIDVVSLDWLTFIRTHKETIDLFCARASLAPAKLVAMFEPKCLHRAADLVYYASSGWQADDISKKFLNKEFYYAVGNKKRKLVFFKAHGMRRTVALKGHNKKISTNKDLHE